MGGSSRLKRKSGKVITRYLVRSFWVSTVEAASDDEQTSTVIIREESGWHSNLRELKAL